MTGVPPANAAQPMPFFTNLIASYAQHVVVVDGSWLTGLGNDLSNPLLRITQSSLIWVRLSCRPDRVRTVSDTPRNPGQTP
jgi:hypothetical protein